METTIVEPRKKRIRLEDKQTLVYCISNVLRDEQIRVNNAKVKLRVEPRYELRREPIAIVNFGPSLNDTWEKIKEFPYVMTCSGAHKFLVERGITPTHHLDVDPRDHKIKLIGMPQKNTEYLIASTCHPKLFDFLLDAGCTVKLWHIFDTSEDGFRLLPPGEWAITGGCSVGVRTLTMARFLGFTDLSIFGMDGCSGASGKHAAEHPNQPKDDYVLEYDGKEYLTTPSMLEAAKNTWHELDMMGDVKATFFGTGLVQHMAKNYNRKVIEKPSFIGFNKPELISAEYRELNKKLHADNLLYGVGGGKHAPTVMKLVQSMQKTIPFPRVLDYGCGRSYLKKALPFPIDEYDPAIVGKDESPRPADLVVSSDVLEHVEPDKLDAVLDDIRRCTRQIAFLVIHTGPSSKILADGRNSHLIVEGEAFWKKQLEKYFSVPKNGFIFKSPLLYAIVAPKKMKSHSTKLIANAPITNPAPAQSP